MNREILFRGKRLDNGEWVTGRLITDDRDGKEFIVSGIGYHCEEDIDSANRYIECFGFEVDPETVGQYTGLKDKNGVKIFEGDIVKQHYFQGCAGSNLGYSEVDAEIIGVVGRDFAGTYTVLADGVHYYWLDILEESEEQLEVIGNRWDNPELLEVLGDE